MTCRMMLATSVWGLTLTAQRTHVDTSHVGRGPRPWAVSSAFGTLMADICSVLGSCFLMGWHHPPQARWLDLTVSVDKVTQRLSKEYKSLAITETVQRNCSTHLFPCWESWPPLSMSFSRVGWPWLWPWTRSGPKPRCGLRLAVGQSLMASVCHSVSQNWSTAVWYLLIITHINLPINITAISNSFCL